MKCEILYPGAFPMVRVQLAAGESFKAESGAMVSMSPTLDVESKMEGGLQELDETGYWLEILGDADIVQSQRTRPTST